MSLPKEMYDQLREIADVEDISINDLIVYALNEYWLDKEWKPVRYDNGTRWTYNG